MQQRQQMNPAPAPPQRMPAPLPHPSGAVPNMPAPISYSAASVAGVGTHSIFSLSKYRVTFLFYKSSYNNPLPDEEERRRERHRNEWSASRILNPSAEADAGRSDAQRRVADELQRRVHNHHLYGTPISSGGEDSSGGDISSDEN